MTLILPNNVTILDKNLYVLNVFVMNNQMQLVHVETYPQPTQVANIISLFPEVEFNGVSLEKIKKYMEAPVNKILNTAREVKECKVMFMVTELETFKENQKKATALQHLNMTAHNDTSKKEEDKSE